MPTSGNGFILAPAMTTRALSLRSNTVRSLALSTALVASPALLTACEQLGIKANIVTTTTSNGKTTTKTREAKNWGEFKQAMGEVATDFSSFAKQVGATTAELVKKLVDVPPAGKVALGGLDPNLKQYEGNKKYDFITDAASKPDAAYDFTYVQIGMTEYDNFFKASAEMYGTAFQLIETGRHIRMTTAALTGKKPDDKSKVDDELSKLESAERTDENGDVVDTGKDLSTLWKAVAPLGVQLAKKTGEFASAGVQLVASAPKQITNPKLVLHIKLIVKGLDQSVGLVKDTGKLLVGIVG